VKLIHEHQAGLSSHEIEQMEVNRLAALDVRQNQKPIDSHPYLSNALRNACVQNEPKSSIYSGKKSPQEL
jgi:hypothetical protein